MHSCRDKYAFLCFGFFTIRITFLRSYSDILTSISRQSPAKGAPVDEVLGESVALNPRQIVAQVGVSVGEAVGEVDLVVSLSEGVCEGQSVVATIPPIAFAFECVPMVADIMTDSVPGELFRAVAAHLGEAKHAHSLIV